MRFLINYHNFITLKLVLIVLILNWIWRKKRIINRPKEQRQINKYIIISIILLLIPFNLIFANFKTPIKAYEYYFPGDRIWKVEENKNEAYVLATSDSFLYCYVKKDHKWKLQSEGENNWSQFEWYNIRVSRIPGMDIVGVGVFYPKSNSSQIKVSDSLGTKFDDIVIDKGRFDEGYAHVAIIHGAIDENYTLNINGKEFKPLG